MSKNRDRQWEEAAPAPKLSIVVPAYNRPDMLADCLGSLRSVSVDCEIVVVDDASSTDLTATFSRCAAHDARLRFIRNQNNLGPTANFNRALMEARGEYLCLMGDDDEVLPGCFEKKVALLDANPEVGLVYSLWQRMDEDGRDLGVCRWPGLVDFSYVSGRNEFLDLLPASYLSLHSAVFRRTLWEEQGGFDEHLTHCGNDWDMLLRYCHSTQTAFISEPLLKVRVHSTASTSDCARSGGFAQGKLATWRKWLLENEEPPVLEDRTWHRMVEIFRQDLMSWLGNDAQKHQPYLAELKDLYEAYSARMARRSAELLSSLATPAAEPAAQRIARATAAPQKSQQPTASAPSASAAPATLPQIVWTGPIFDASGYASALRSHAHALRAASLSARLQELRWSNLDAGLPENEMEALRRMLQTPAIPGQRHLRVWQTFPRFFQADPQASAVIGRFYFETDRIPADWAAAADRADLLWVPSFNLETYPRAGIRPEKLRALPDCIDPSRFGPDVPPADFGTDRSFHFLSIFEWIPRKGWDVLVRAFIEEFKPDEDVALYLKVHSSTGKKLEDIGLDLQRLISQAVGDGPIPPIQVSNGVIRESTVPSLYRAANAYVQPHRGEGWGRPLMEAMASGLPTIGTRWSAPLEFMNDANSYLLDCQVVDVPTHVLKDQPYYGGHRWAEPSVEHLRALMRQVFRDREQAARRGARAAEEISARYNPRVVGERIRELAEEAVDRFGGPSQQPVAQIAATPQPQRNGVHVSTPIAAPQRPLDDDISTRRGVPMIWEGGFFETHSLALVNREICLALLKSGDVDLSLQVRQLEPNRYDPHSDPRLAPLLSRVDRTLLDEPAIHVRHAWPPVFQRPRADKWVMIQPWEYGGLPEDWVAPMRDQVDEIWIPSRAVKDMYVASSVPAEKVFVVPNGVDTERFRPGVAPLALPTQKSFRFLFVGGTIWRKGIDVLLEAYRREFSRRDDVCLVIKDMGQDSFYKGQGAAEAIARIQADSQAPEILYATNTLRDQDMARLYAACQALVHPYRGEGFGLPVAEAMACGLPVIVTQGGACDDFCTDERAFMVPSSRKQINIGKPTAGPAWVLDPDLGALAATMRQVYESSRAAADKGRLATAWVHQNLTWEAAAARALARIDALAAAGVR